MKISRVIYIVVALFGFVPFVGCTNNEEAAIAKINEAFQDAISKIDVSEERMPVYIVIPKAGCPGCISEAESFMLSTLKKENNMSEKIRFILTDFQSEKILKARFGSLYKDKRIILDRPGAFSSHPSLHSIYPIIFFLDKKGEVLKVSAFSLDENGLTSIHNFLATEDFK